MVMHPLITSAVIALILLKEFSVPSDAYGRLLSLDRAAEDEEKGTAMFRVCSK